MDPLSSLDRVLDDLPDWMELTILGIVVVLLLWRPIQDVVRTLDPIERNHRASKAKAEAVFIELASRALANTLADSGKGAEIRAAVEADMDKEAAKAATLRSGLYLSLSASLGSAIFVTIAALASYYVGALTDSKGHISVDSVGGFAIFCFWFVASGFALNFWLLRALGFFSRVGVTASILFVVAYLIVGLKTMLEA